MGELAAALRGLADEIVTSTTPARSLDYATGTVTAVAAGVVTVQALGAAQQIAYLGAAPAVGATVAVLFIDGSPLILGAVNGIPTF